MAGYSADVVRQQLVFEEYKWMGVSTPVHVPHAPFPFAVQYRVVQTLQSRVVTIACCEASIAQKQLCEAQPWLTKAESCCVGGVCWGLKKGSEIPSPTSKQIPISGNEVKRNYKKTPLSEVKPNAFLHNSIHEGRIYRVPSTGRLWTRHYGQNKDKSRCFPFSEGKHFHYHSSLLFTLPPY